MSTNGGQALRVTADGLASDLSQFSGRQFGPSRGGGGVSERENAGWFRESNPAPPRPPGAGGAARAWLKKKLEN